MREIILFVFLAAGLIGSVFYLGMLDPKKERVPPTGQEWMRLYELGGEIIIVHPREGTQCFVVAQMNQIKGISCVR